MDDELLASRLHFLCRRLAQAQRQYALFADGDRVAVAISGGKDSAALLLALAAWRRNVPLRLELAGVHVELDPHGPAPELGRFLQQLRELTGISVDSLTAPPDAGTPAGGRRVHPCFHCAWRRREALFRWATGHGCNKLALGHHLDDAAETALMNLLYQGRLEALPPARSFFAGAVTLVRPLILAEERELVRIAACLDVAPVTCRCDTADGAPPDSARAAMKSFLRSLGKESRAAKRHLWRAAGERR